MKKAAPKTKANKEALTPSQALALIEYLAPEADAEALSNRTRKDAFHNFASDMYTIAHTVRGIRSCPHPDWMADAINRYDELVKIGELPARTQRLHAE